MISQIGPTETAWTASSHLPGFPMLDADVETHVCIIGAGIAGITIGYLLARSGLGVVIVDDGRLGGGETCRTTAHLSNVIDDRYSKIIREHGVDNARLAFESHNAAIDLIETNIQRERIDCDFARVDGFLFRGEGEEKVLDDELLALNEINFPGFSYLQSTPLARLADRPCIRFPRQAQFHVLKYVQGLTDAFLSANGRIFTNTHVEKIEDGEFARVTTSSDHAIKAKFVVVATNSPISDLVKIHTKQAAYRSYVIGAKVPKQNNNAPGLFWDTEDPYHYVRFAPFDENYNLVIIGGEDHKTGQDDNASEHFDVLEGWARSLFPEIEEIEYRWSGQIMETVDGLAFIGRDPGHAQNVFVATGDSGMGMTHGTIAGMLISDLIKGQDNPWTELYDPSRKPLRAAMTYLRENVNAVAQYTDYARAPDMTPADVPVGEGAVLRKDGSLVATYKDENGQIYECSAVCPHLKAIVRWNNAEKTWDCPAHGSRFRPSGRVINGPANQDLPPCISGDSGNGCNHG